ncbi:hypothetical protein ACHAWF_017401 [Thalassiosira exigua]
MGGPVRFFLLVSEFLPGHLDLARRRFVQWHPDGSLREIGQGVRPGGSYSLSNGNPSLFLLLPAQNRCHVAIPKLSPPRPPLSPSAGTPRRIGSAPESRASEEDDAAALAATDGVGVGVENLAALALLSATNPAAGSRPQSDSFRARLSRVGVGRLGGGNSRRAKKSNGKRALPSVQKNSKPYDTRRGRRRRSAQKDLFMSRRCDLPTPWLRWNRGKPTEHLRPASIYYTVIPHRAARIALACFHLLSVPAGAGAGAVVAASEPTQKDEVPASEDEDGGGGKGLLSSLTSMTNSIFDSATARTPADAVVANNFRASSKCPKSAEELLIDDIQDDEDGRNYLCTGDLEYVENVDNLVPVVYFFLGEGQSCRSELLEISLNNAESYVETRWNMLDEVPIRWRRRRREGVWGYNGEWEVPIGLALLQLVTPEGTIPNSIWKMRVNEVNAPHERAEDHMIELGCRFVRRKVC